MARMRFAMLTLVVALVAGVSLLAHEITYTGTVLSVEATTVRVNVVDEKAKKVTPMAFDLDEETKIQRGDKPVTLAEARIQKDEKISVTIDHDLDERLAIAVKLEPRR